MKALLIIGNDEAHKVAAARVAVQIAEQHHGISATVTSTPPRMTKAAPGAGLAVVITGRKDAANIAQRTVLNMDRFARFPHGKAVTFAIRDAVSRAVNA